MDPLTHNDLNEGETAEYTSVEEYRTLKGFKIMHLNARSLLPKLDDIVHNFTPHTNILCFTETWFKPELPMELTQIKGYQLVRNDRRKKRGGGTCIFIKEGTEFEVISQISDFHLELQTLSIKGSNAKTIILINCYRPPSGNSEIAVSMIKNCLNQIENVHKCEIVLVGDLNIDYSNKESYMYKTLSTIEEEFMLEQKIRSSTRIHKCTSTLLDVFTNIRNIYKSGCINYNISDHLPVYIIKKRINIVREKQYVYCRTYQSYNKHIFQGNLSKLDWSILDELDNVDDM